MCELLLLQFLGFILVVSLLEGAFFIVSLFLLITLTEISVSIQTFSTLLMELLLFLLSKWWWPKNDLLPSCHMSSSITFVKALLTLQLLFTTFPEGNSDIGTFAPPALLLLLAFVTSPAPGATAFRAVVSHWVCLSLWNASILCLKEPDRARDENVRAERVPHVKVPSSFQLCDLACLELFGCTDGESLFCLLQPFL